jgi:tetratricopeptide (TPR) repeat protein
LRKRASFYLKKAGLLACFFLTFQTLFAVDKIWQFSPEMQKAYQLVLNLQPELALVQLNKITNKSEELHKMYVLSLNETIDILVTEDLKRLEQFETNFKLRQQVLDELPETPEILFLRAELNLQRGFNLLNMGQEFNAVFAIRRAYNLVQDCQKKYPDYLPIKKTSGVIQVMVGSVPDKYAWFMGLLGMRGQVTTGQKLLSDVRHSKSSLSLEATILFFTIKGFINQHFADAAQGMKECLKEQPDNRLVLFIAINMLMKDSQAENALELFNVLDKQSQGLQMYYVEYLRGEALLQKGEYQKAILAFQKFQKGYRSTSYRKDSYYKISLCYWLMGDETQAKSNFEKAKITGKENAEPDKYAAKQLEEPNLPNIKILKARLYTDGGYYPEATAALQSIGSTELKTLKEQTEFFYRKARLAHKLHDLPAAKTLYLQSISMTKDNPWYFAANSALQLGYISQEQKDYAAAKKYFEQALGYKKHEYKNSIDNKAKAALDELKALKV